MTSPLLFLDPGHFHAALTLRVPNERVPDEIFVYAAEGPELHDFLALIDRFNRRADEPTSWKPVVTACADPLSRLVQERRGDRVVLAGRNGGKARTIRALHDAGFHVLADKPWLVEPGDLDAIAASLSGWPLAMEIMTGRHDVAARLVKTLVSRRDVFGDFRVAGPAIELESVHCLEKLVDGAPLRRPPWYFDVRVQGRGIVDITTHVVDQTLWMVDGEPRLVSARAWPTAVPLDAFRRMTGHDAFPRELAPRVAGDVLSYECNSELRYRIGDLEIHAITRWDLAGAGDSSRMVAHGTRADVVREQRPGGPRRVFVEPRSEHGAVRKALMDAVLGWQDDFPWVGVESRDDDRHEITIPAGHYGGHETHFPEVLELFLRLVEERDWPVERARDTLVKYELLAAAAAAS